MKKVFVITLGMLLALNLPVGARAAEYGGKEHGGATTSAQEHGGTTQAQTPSTEDIRSAMKSYVEAESQKTGGDFEVVDPDTNQTRQLQLLRVHERVGKTGDYYYSCADFKDVNSGEMLDLDLDVADQAGKLAVVDVRVHKVGGEERYTYDENDNRIPLGDTKSHLGTTAPEGKEHGGY